MVRSDSTPVGSVSDSTERDPPLDVAAEIDLQKIACINQRRASPPVGLTALKLSCGEAPGASGKAARRLPQLTICRRAASASGVTP